ncbi:hypothetical protein EPN90_01580 [Patescibacteria group bacterium]|nr:MAG: hypothetical protein EPN90_01580 [Patescibacteria group bacterium]
MATPRSGGTLEVLMLLIEQAVEAMHSGDVEKAAEIADSLPPEEGERAAVAYLQRAGLLPPERVTGAVVVWDVDGLATFVFAFRFDRREREIREMPSAVYLPDGRRVALPLRVARKFWASRQGRCGSMPIEFSALQADGCLWHPKAEAKLVVVRAVRRANECGLKELALELEPLEYLTRRVA